MTDNVHQLDPDEAAAIAIQERVRSELQSSHVINALIDRLQLIHDEAVAQIRDVPAMDTARIMDLQVDMRLTARLNNLLEEIANLGSATKMVYEDGERLSEEDASLYRD